MYGWVCGVVSECGDMKMERKTCVWRKKSLPTLQKQKKKKKERDPVAKS